MQRPDDWEELDDGAGISPSRYDREDPPDHCLDCGSELVKGGGPFGFTAHCPNCGIVFSF